MLLIYAVSEIIVNSGFMWTLKKPGMKLTAFVPQLIAQTRFAHLSHWRIYQLS